MKNRRTLILGGAILAAALVVVLVVVLASGGGGSPTKTVKTGKAAPGGPETQQLLGGIPQSGFTLGEPSAKLTLIEFNDMQCPVCREYDAKVFPTLIDRLDVAKLMSARNTAAADQALATGKQEFSAAGFDGTPSFLIGPTGGPMKTLSWTALDPAQFTKQIDALLK
jgi:protein-disulfide isomerase